MRERGGWVGEDEAGGREEGGEERRWEEMKEGATKEGVGECSANNRAQEVHSARHLPRFNSIRQKILLKY